MKTIAFMNSTINRKFIESCDIADISCGAANGYVAVPPEHHGKGYDDIDGIDVHGGLTCSGRLKGYDMPDIELISDVKEIPSDWWIFGFDTMHFNDNQFTWPKERVKEETLRLQAQLESLSLSDKDIDIMGTADIQVSECMFSSNGDYIRMKAQIAVLKEVHMDYPGKTIDNIIQQMEARTGEMEKGCVQ